jgi:glycosyltransferase involved in cell wall biosynthesis
MAQRSIPKVSIIIATYNAEKYLPQCLDSVINQTLQDTEILCVNDGSTDDSLYILQEYSKKDNRIKVFTQENQGEAKAKNTGLENAVGEYIWFVDADDWCESTAATTIYEKVKAYNADMIIFAARLYDERQKAFAPTDRFGVNNQYIWLLNMIPKQYDDKLFVFEETKEWLLNVPFEFWNRFYKRSFLVKYGIKPHADLLMGVDCFFNVECYLNSAKIVVLKDVLYNYRIGVGTSMVSNFTSSKYKYYDYSLIIAKKTNDIIRKKGIGFDVSKYLIKRDFSRICAHYNMLKGINKIKFHIKTRDFLIEQKDLYTDYILKFTNQFELINKIKNTTLTKYLFRTVSDKIAKTVKTNDKKVVKILGIEIYKRKIDKLYKRKYIFGILVYKKKMFEIFERLTDKTSKKEILKLKNLYLNKGRLFIIGNAPSINDMDLSPLNKEHTFTVSRGYMLKSKGLQHATFYCICDKHSYQNYGNEIDLDFADYFFASTWTGWKRKCNNLYTFDVSSTSNGIKEYNKLQFDISKPIITGRTVVLEALQIAVYLGFKEIYFIGVDLNFATPERHFYKSNERENDEKHIKWANENTQAMIENFRIADRILRRKNIRIFNAGIEGNLNSIERVEYSSLFEKDKK